MLAVSMIVMLVCQQLVAGALAINSPYSLQPAVDALQRREAQLWNYRQPMRRNNYDDREVDGNEAYESLINNDQYFDERKRSMFRERGDDQPPSARQPSAFRERAPQPELAAQFLEAIAKERKREREQHYKDQIQTLWQNYEQQENVLDNDMLENENRQLLSDAANDGGERADRTSDERFADSAYQRDILGDAMQKRRLIMPFMPVRKRGFSMQKRSSPPAPVFGRMDASLSGTDEKVARDLQAIFSAPQPMKSKRSSGPAAPTPAAVTSTLSSPPLPTMLATSESAIGPEPTGTAAAAAAAIEKKDARSQRDQGDHHDLDHDGFLAEHDAGHASPHRGHDPSHKGHDHDRDHDHEHEHDDHVHGSDGSEESAEHAGDGAHEHDREEDADSAEQHGDGDDDDDDEHDDRKRKRDAAVKRVVAKRGNQEVLKEDQIIPGDLSDFKRKKSVEWSKYFGIDRRKKSTEWATKEADKPKALEDYTTTHFRNHDQVVARPKLEVDEKKLENMGQRLKTIEELIIEETMKFTADHEGMTNPENLKQLRNHVISRLATAYSLEKLRRALDMLKQSVDQERHINENELDMARKELDEDNARTAAEEDSDESQDKDKRVAVKKEKVQFDNNLHNIDAVTEHNLAGGNSMLMPGLAQGDRFMARRDNIAGGDGDDDSSQSRSRDKKQSAFEPTMPMMIGGARPLRQHQQQLADVVQRQQGGNKRPPATTGFDALVERFVPIDEYTANGIVDDECPMLDDIEKRCRAVLELSGDMHQQFLPLCGWHQLCYMCGTSPDQCDYKYVDEADMLCAGNRACHTSGQTALMMLRDSPVPQLGPRKCRRNSCLKRAMQEFEAV